MVRFGSDGPIRRPQNAVTAFGMNVYTAVGRPDADAEIREREGGGRMAVDDGCRRSDGGRVERAIRVPAFIFRDGLVGLLEQRGRSGPFIRPRSRAGFLRRRLLDVNGPPVRRKNGLVHRLR